jgi:hypothetical protein
MMTYAFVKVGIGASDMARSSFFNSVEFQVGEDVFSFQDLENGILRSNRKAVASTHLQFGPKDHRIALCMPRVDCRIHFALSCGEARD